MEHYTIGVVGKTLDQHLADCVVETRATRVAITELTRAHEAISIKLDGFNSWAWKAVGAVCFVIFSGVVSVIVSYSTFHSSATTVAESAATTAASTASSVASSDRSRQDAQTAEILAAIRNSKK